LLAREILPRGISWFRRQQDALSNQPTRLNLAFHRKTWRAARNAALRRR
jgi:hypothetical protein